MEPAPPAPPPGLKWRRRKDGGVRAVWVAQQAAVAAGFPVKTVNLTHLTGDPAALRARCEILQAEMRAWISGRVGYKPEFDGTFGTLLALYETDPDSTFHKLKPTSARPYGVYLRKLKRTITLTELKDRSELKDFALVQRGNRLSVLPVTKAQRDFILSLEQ